MQQSAKCKVTTAKTACCRHRLITVARDSGRPLSFGGVIYLFFLFSFFRPPICQRPWADFRETARRRGMS